MVDLDEQGEEVFSDRKAAALTGHATVFFLNAPLQNVMAKLAGADERPPLGDRSPEEIYQRRLPMYRRVAHHEIKMEKGKRKKAAKEILEILATGIPGTDP